MSERVVIVGAGLGGLACGRRLAQLGIPFRILEAGDRVGGRTRTDVVDGFQLDHGFHVLLTALPEARRVLDFAALDLHPLSPGVLVQTERGRLPLSDPWRRPREALRELASSPALFSDKARMARFRARVMAADIDEILAASDVSARWALEKMTFSQDFIRRVLAPMFGGMMLDPNLEGSSRVLALNYKMLCEGDAALPAAGIEAVPRQLAATLSPDTIRTGTRVREVSNGKVTLEDGETIECEAVVIATGGADAARLVSAIPALPHRAVTCCYFSCERAPVTDPILLVNGCGEGPVTNLCFPSRIAPTYAPRGRDLVSATVLGEADPDDRALEESVLRQLGSWFGASASEWRLLRIFRIRDALPSRPPTRRVDATVERLASERLFVCGDHRVLPSIHGALLSGRRTAEQVALSLAGSTSGRARPTAAAAT